MKEQPEYLYKYMSLDTLALILENKTIRLNPLTAMDDLQEEKTKDQAKWGRYCFVSCWTEEEQEIIPMWKMYCNRGSGVRLKLSSTPFKEIIYTEEEIKKLQNSHTYNGAMKAGQTGNLPIKYCINPEIIPVDRKVELVKVKYSNDVQKLEPKVIHLNTEKDSRESLGNLDFSCLGTIKNKYWEFQKEWRYIVSCIPNDFGFLKHETEKDLANGICHCDVAKYKCIDIPLSGDALSKAEIMAAPDMTEGNKLILQKLCKIYKIAYKESSLSGLVR